MIKVDLLLFYLEISDKWVNFASRNIKSPHSLGIKVNENFYLKYGSLVVEV